jgi:hypothetical protein
MQALLAEMSGRDLSFEDASIQTACESLGQSHPKPLAFVHFQMPQRPFTDAGAQLLTSFSGELSDLVDALEAGTMANGNGVVTNAGLERVRSQMVCRAILV